MKTIAGVTKVVFDPIHRRFEGLVFLPAKGGQRMLNVSAPGHPCWTYRRIKSALIASAQVQARKGLNNACA